MDDGQYCIEEDGSSVGCGAVLSQLQADRWRVIEYASRTFNRAERSYCVTKIEMCALVFGLRHFRSYLLGHKFICRVDHMALTYYQKTVEPVGQQARYLDFIAQFDFELQYRPGKHHANCDALSRRRPCEVNGGEPCKQCNRRVTGKHVNAVRTRSKWRRQQLESASQAGEVAADPGRANTPISGAEPSNKRGGPIETAERQNRPQRPRKGKGSKVSIGTGLLYRIVPNAADGQVGRSKEGAWDHNL